MGLSVEEHAVLELAAEDYCGLWEARWRLDSLPSAVTAGSYDRAVGVVRSLVLQELVELFVRRPGADEPELADEADPADRGIWDEPQVGGTIWLMLATEAGEQALRAWP